MAPVSFGYRETGTTAECVRVVLDTNVALALFAFADPSCAGLALALREGRMTAVANLLTRAEWLRVLGHERLGLLDSTRVHAERTFDERVVDVGHQRPAPTALPRCRDPDDQVFLELARDAGCAWLFSRDRELLMLSKRTQRDFGFAVVRPETYDETALAHTIQRRDIPTTRQ